jgi:hypothetical protein
MPGTSEKVKQTQSQFPAQAPGVVAECPYKGKSNETPAKPAEVKTSFDLTQNILHTIGARTTPQKAKEKKAWIEIILVDMEGKPVPGVKYRITPPGGQPVEGRLNEHGQAGLYQIEPGNCKITFPDLDKDAWE